MNIVNVYDRMTDALLLTFECAAVFLISPCVFFADGTQYNTTMEVYLETITANDVVMQNKSVARPLYDVQILGASHTHKEGRNE